MRHDVSKLGAGSTRTTKLVPCCGDTAVRHTESAVRNCRSPARKFARVAQRQSSGARKYATSLRKVPRSSRGRSTSACQRSEHAARRRRFGRAAPESHRRSATRISQIAPTSRGPEGTTPCSSTRSISRRSPPLSSEPMLGTQSGAETRQVAIAWEPRRLGSTRSLPRPRLRGRHLLRRRAHS